MIDIIIPCYNSKKLKRCLGSILAQTYTNYKVTLVNDGGDYYNYNNCLIPIKELSYAENRGPGYARNYGIEHTNGDYIVFVDSDDCLATPYSLAKLYESFKDKPMGVGSILVETPEKMKILQNNKNFLHGKIYKRTFIEENNIRFKDSRCCEDYSFNLICMGLLNGNITYSTYLTYCWMYNHNSLGRKNPIEWEKCTVPQGLVDNFIYAFNELDKRNCHNDNIYYEKVRGMIHFFLLSFHISENYPQYKNNIREVVTKYYNEIYKHLKVDNKMLDRAFEMYAKKGVSPQKLVLIKTILAELN